MRGIKKLRDRGRDTERGGEEREREQTHTNSTSATSLYSPCQIHDNCILDRRNHGNVFDKCK